MVIILPLWPAGCFAFAGFWWAVLRSLCLILSCKFKQMFPILWLNDAWYKPKAVKFWQAIILEWVAMHSSRGSSWPRDRTHISLHLLHWQVDSLPLVPPGKPKVKALSTHIYVYFSEPPSHLPSPSHPSESSQCTSPEHPVSCIEPGLAIHFTYDNIYVSMPFSQIIPPLSSPTESKRLFYTSVSLLLGTHILNILRFFFFKARCLRVRHRTIRSKC